jgi:hypothetical protein
MEISLVAEDSMKVGDYNELTIACAAQHGLPCGRGESKPGEANRGQTTISLKWWSVPGFVPACAYKIVASAHWR